MICYNYNLPYFQNIVLTYGKHAAAEIIAYIGTDEFKQWYGNEYEFPEIQNHIIKNSDGKSLDVRSLINVMKNEYADYLSSNLPTEVMENRIDKFFRKSHQQKLILPSSFDNLEDQHFINSIIKKSIENIKLKANKTYDEQQLLQGKISIEKYFGLNDQFKYIPENKYDTNDALFEVYHKLKIYADSKYLPLINFLANNSDNTNVTFSKISSPKKDDKYSKLMSSKFAALYKPNLSDNSATIILNEYQLKKQNLIDSKFTYNDNVVKYLLHELLHEYTNYRFNIDDDFKQKFIKIYDYIMENLPENHTSMIRYNMTEPHEIITYVFSDDLFKETLEKIPSFKNNNISIYTDTINLIKKAMNIKDGSIVEQLLEDSIETISLKNDYNTDYAKIENLKRLITNRYHYLNSKILSVIIDSVNVDWLSYKFNNKTEAQNNFNEFQENFLKKIHNCL